MGEGELFYAALVLWSLAVLKLLATVSLRRHMMAERRRWRREVIRTRRENERLKVQLESLQAERSVPTV